MRLQSFQTEWTEIKIAVLCFENCSDLLLEKKIMAEGHEFARNLGSPKQYIQTVKDQNNFWW